jgi:hypothetical protein
MTFGFDVREGSRRLVNWLEELKGKLGNRSERAPIGLAGGATAR